MNYIKVKCYNCKDTLLRMNKCKNAICFKCKRERARKVAKEYQRALKKDLIGCF